MYSRFIREELIMKKKLLILPVLCLLLTGCKKAPEHVHTFSDGWESNDAYHWHPATCGHDVIDGKAPHTPNDYHFCTVCGRYVEPTYSFDEELSPRLEQGKHHYIRIGQATDEEYGLWTNFNIDSGNEAYCVPFVFVNGEKSNLLENPTEDGEHHCLHLPSNADDKYIYLDLYYEGSAETVELENVEVRKLTNACDEDKWYYGAFDNDLINGSCDFEWEGGANPDKHINGKYYVAFVPQDPNDLCYEITIDTHGEGEYVLKVWQDFGAGHTGVEEVPTNSHGYYLPQSSNEMIIEIDSAVPGTHIDCCVTENVRPWEGNVG